MILSLRWLIIWRGKWTCMPMGKGELITPAICFTGQKRPAREPEMRTYEDLKFAPVNVLSAEGQHDGLFQAFKVNA